MSNYDMNKLLAKSKLVDPNLEPPQSNIYERCSLGKMHPPKKGFNGKSKNIITITIQMYVNLCKIKWLYYFITFKMISLALSYH
jgi:hypothetical protein